VTRSGNCAEEAILGVEIPADVRDQLAIRRVIYGLHADDLRLEAATALVDVLDELELGAPGADDKDLIDVGEGFLDCREVVDLVGRVVVLGSAVGVSFKVVMRLDLRGVETFAVDVKDPSFIVIDPDRGMLRHDALQAPKR
jgi:hypothetical protein